MDNILLIFFILITIVISGVLVWLLQGHNKLKQDNIALRESLERSNKDVAGLCSAAVYVDTQISENKQQLETIEEKIFELERQKDASHPYHTAIQKVRNGADAEELVLQCNLSQEEAILLIRLHGNGMTPS